MCIKCVVLSKGLVPFTQLVKVRRGMLVLALPSIRLRERFIPSHNIIKICYQNHCALQMLDSRSNMVITDLLPGAPLMFLLAILAAHPVYISD